MLRRFVPSPATVVAVAALVFAMAGTSYALQALPANSVGPRQLKNRAVTTQKLANRAVTAEKVRANSLTGAQIDESTLEDVPTAGIAGLAYAQQAVVIPPETAIAVMVPCRPPLTAISGGAAVPDPSVFLLDSHAVVATPTQSPGWQTLVGNAGEAAAVVTYQAVCARGGPAETRVRSLRQRPEVRIRRFPFRR